MTDDNKKKWRTVGNAYETALTKGTGGNQIICVIEKSLPPMGDGNALRKLYLFPNIDQNGNSSYVIRVRESDIS